MVQVGICRLLIKLLGSPDVTSRPGMSPLSSFSTTRRQLLPRRSCLVDSRLVPPILRRYFLQNIRLPLNDGMRVGWGVMQQARAEVVYTFYRPYPLPPASARSLSVQLCFPTI